MYIHIYEYIYIYRYTYIHMLRANVHMYTDSVTWWTIYINHGVNMNIHYLMPSEPEARATEMHKEKSSEAGRHANN